MQSWTPDQTDACLSPLLSGPAANLFYSLEEGNRRNWEYVLNLIAEEFVSRQVTGSGQTQFLRATLGPAETLTDFYWRLKELGRRAFPSLSEEQDDMLTEAFLRGLPHPYQGRLVPLHFANSREALRAAQRIEGFYPGVLGEELLSRGDPVFQMGDGTQTGGRVKSLATPSVEESRMSRLERSMEALTTTVADALKVICEKVSASKKEEAPRRLG